MHMSGEVRVKTDRKHKTLYNEMKNLAVGDMHELFFICACLGYKEKKKKELGGSGEDRFWSTTFTPEEYTCFYAMLLEESDMDFSVIEDDKHVISEIEQYANAGMDILLDKFLSDHLTKNKEQIQLDPTLSREMPKMLLHYIYGQL